MIIYDIEISDGAFEDIDSIEDYIFRFSFDKVTVKKVSDQIYSEIFSLKILPHRFSKYNDKYRVLTIRKKYRVLYRIDEKNKKIIIATVFSTSQDYENYNF